MTPEDERRIRRDAEGGWEVSGAHARDVKLLLEELDKREAWIADLQSGMYINCVYCGHRYGPANNTPESKAVLLKHHISRCTEHPMSALLDACRMVSEGVNTIVDNWMHWDDEQIRAHLFGLQEIAQAAVDKAEAQS